MMGIRSVHQLFQIPFPFSHTMLRLSSNNDQFSSELGIHMPYKRTIRFTLADALSTSPAVLITGARQSGKTTAGNRPFQGQKLSL